MFVKPDNTHMAFFRISVVVIKQSQLFKGFNVAFLNIVLVPAPKKPHFFSSDESEEEEDHRKKFKIKIKPLPADRVVAVPSVDELKASIGNIALSPSPMVSSFDSFHCPLTAGGRCISD